MTDHITTDKAPAAIGPYAQAARSLTNIAAIAEAAGTSLSKAVKMTVYVTDLTQFKAVNEVYAAFFQAPFPARSTVEVSALPLGASVEIDAVIAL